MTILFYVESGCGRCAEARAFLTRRGVEWIEKDIGLDRDALRDLLAMTGRASVPALVVDRTAMVGFDEEQWARMLTSS